MLGGKTVFCKFWGTGMISVMPVFLSSVYGHAASKAIFHRNLPCALLPCGCFCINRLTSGVSVKLFKESIAKPIPFFFVFLVAHKQ